MNMINNIKYAFLPVVMFTMATFTSCEEDIEIGNKIDESSYLASTQLSGLLLDENTNKNSSVIESEIMNIALMWYSVFLNYLKKE